MSRSDTPLPPEDAAARLAATPDEAAASPAGLVVAMPALAGFTPPQRELAAMLPVSDINGALMAGAHAFAERGHDRLCAGVLLVDPFLVIDDLVAALAAGGFARVANFPTVQLLDGEAGAGLAAVGYDLAAELRQLAVLAVHGLTPHVYVVDAEAARVALAAGFVDLVFHAAFRRAPEAAEVLEQVRREVDAAGARLRVHAGG
jgi:predicted TIM-barrel enzyme